MNVMAVDRPWACVCSCQNIYCNGIVGNGKVYYFATPCILVKFPEVFQLDTVI
jgi:hypothetical protein